MKIARDCSETPSSPAQRRANTVGGWGLKVSGRGEKWRHATHENPTLFRFQFAAPQRRVNSFQKEFFTWSWVAPSVSLALLTKESRNWRFFRPQNALFFALHHFNTSLLSFFLFFFLNLFILFSFTFAICFEFFWSNLCVKERKRKKKEFRIASRTILNSVVMGSSVSRV